MGSSSYISATTGNLLYIQIAVLTWRLFCLLGKYAQPLMVVEWGTFKSANYQGRTKFVINMVFPAFKSFHGKSSLFYEVPIFSIFSILSIEALTLWSRF